MRQKVLACFVLCAGKNSGNGWKGINGCAVCGHDFASGQLTHIVSEVVKQVGHK